MFVIIQFACFWIFGSSVLVIIASYSLYALFEKWHPNIIDRNLKMD